MRPLWSFSVLQSGGKHKRLLGFGFLFALGLFFFFFSGNTELLFFLNVKIYLVFIETIKGILPLNYICVQWKLPSDGWNSFFDSMPCARSLSSMPVQQSYSMFPYSIFECLLMQFLCICYVFNALMFI